MRPECKRLGGRVLFFFFFFSPIQFQVFIFPILLLRRIPLPPFPVQSRPTSPIDALVLVTIAPLGCG